MINSTVDTLGSLLAQQAALADKIDVLKAELKAAGPGAYDGEMFRATVTIAERDNLDMKAVRAKLTPQFITAHTNRTEVISVRVVARLSE